MTRDRDRGSVLILVLVLMVIGALVMVPLMTYAATVIRSGRVESDKARAVEYARSGLRTALMSTEALYNGCGDASYDPPVTLTPVAGLTQVVSTCQVLDTKNYLGSDEVPYEVATVQIGQPVPAPFANPSTYVNPSTAPDGEVAWHADRSANKESGKVWVPNLPVRSNENRTPSTQPNDNYSRPMSFGTCDVYFPGTYTRPVVVRGPRPTYFVSGVYYFAETLTFNNGANAVLGDGANEGCTSDIDALNYVSNPPDSLLISGVGATLIFGDRGRLIINNSAGPVSVVINQRYVDESEEGVIPTDGVSIMTVNGDIDDANPNGDVLPLFVDDVIDVPPANVTVAGEIVNIAADGYVPSFHTPEPFPPNAPAKPAETAYYSVVCDSASSCADKGAVHLSWSAPANNGFVITSYVVEQRERQGNLSTWTAWTPATCPIDPPSVPGAPVRTSCTVRDLNGWGGGNPTSNARYYEFRVLAVNLGGTSQPSPPTDEVRPDARSTGGTSPQLTAPTSFRVSNNLGSTSSNYSDGKLVSWPVPAEPADTGGLPVASYRVVATPVNPNPAGHPVVTCDSTWQYADCLLPADNLATGTFEGLVDGRSYDVVVTATNAIGPSLAGSPRTLTFVRGGAMFPGRPVPPTPPILRVPDPIIDVRATATHAINLDIAGYVSIPQGRIWIDGGTSPANHTVKLTGGAVAARIDVERLGPNVTVELDNPTTQKFILIRTTVNGEYRAEAEAVVQINESFGWALNSWIVK